MAREPIMVCGTKAIRWNNLVWGYWEAAQREQGRTDIFSDILQNISLVHTLWLRMYENLVFRESNQRRWFRPGSRFFKPWKAFLDFMEENGSMVTGGLYAVGAAVAAIRYFQGLGPLESLDSIPLAILVWTAVIAKLLTPKSMGQSYHAKLKVGFIRLLNLSRSQKASLPKDKIYALYGVTQSLGVPVPRPVYADTYSTEDAYLEFTQSIIRWRGSLDILLEASGPWGLNAPSWVPDWRKPLRRLDFAESRSAGNRPPNFDPLYAFSDNGRELSTKGKRLGVVSFCIVVPDSCSLAVDDTPENRASLPLVQQSVSRRPPTCTLALMEWLNTVTYGFGDELSSAEACKLLACVVLLRGTLTADAIRNWASVLLTEGQRHAAETDTETIHSQDNLSLEHRALTALSTDQDLLQVHERLCVALAGSVSLFLIKANNNRVLLGAGPQSIQLNDIVFSASTMPAPMVLRHADNAACKFHVVGEAHVHGAMQGELWTEASEGGVEEITLV
jgi:hypothetical protein